VNSSRQLNCLELNAFLQSSRLFSTPVLITKEKEKLNKSILITSFAYYLIMECNLQIYTNDKFFGDPTFHIQ
jgi:hypothetical protein